MVRRFTDVNLELFPGKRLIPFLGWTHDAGSGSGISLFVPSMNEYPVPTTYRDRTETFRGGLRLELSRFHVTVEQGGFLFKDDQRLYTSEFNSGNRRNPFLGQDLFLSSLEQDYGVRGDAIYSKAYLTASPFDWIDIHGHFLYSQPKIDTNFLLEAAGLFAQTNPVAFFPVEESLFAAVAKQPHTRGSAGFEIRPASRIRIVESWFTDRLHTSSNVLAGAALDRLEADYNQQQLEGIVDVARGLVLRGGHRYVWGRARTRASTLSPVSEFSSGELRRHVALGGITYRLRQQLSLHVDAEVASGDSAYFRTSLQDYQRIRARVRYQPHTSLGLTYSGSLLNNNNPDARTSEKLDDFEALTVDNSVAAFWTPAGSRYRIIAEYARSIWRTNTLYLAPQTLEPERSRYREDAHIATLLAEAPLPLARSWAPRLTLGGSLFRSAGTRATRYYQPLVRFTAPISKHLEWNAEWRWWGMSQALYFFEEFRNHQALVSVRIF
jgi:hypothetical protein